MYTAYTVDTVYTVDTFDMVYTIDMVHIVDLVYTCLGLGNIPKKSIFFILSASLILLIVHKHTIPL